MERPVSYIRRNFFYGRDFASDDDLNARLLGWLDTVAKVRVHGTLKERSVDRLEVEWPHLKPLARWPYRPVAPQCSGPSPGRRKRRRCLRWSRSSAVHWPSTPELQEVCGEAAITHGTDLGSPPYECF